jgi:glycosyltransferase involved in cell wall biosynthesis
MTGVLSLSTYPIVRPRHGGQRRIKAFADFYRTIGMPFAYACVYEPGGYSGADVSANDLALAYSELRFAGLPFLEDVLSGLFAEKSETAYAHFLAVFEKIQPSIIQLDHPFMWPFVRRLIKEGHAKRTALVYSSHNVEGPLKEDILRKSGAPAKRAQDMRRLIDEMEREVVAASSLVVAVSEADAAYYRPLTRPGSKVCVVHNGVDRPPALLPDEVARVKALYGDRPYAFYVGSAYPPNIEGFVRLVADGGFFFAPPERTVAICGGVSEGIFRSPEYGRFVEANSDRVQFFPDIDDNGLNALKERSHVILLPIQFGGGSNLKTAEALASGKHVVATAMALRGFEPFVSAKGVIIADTTALFRRALITALHAPSLELTAEEMATRDVLYWDRCFERLSGEIVKVHSAVGALAGG